MFDRYTEKARRVIFFARYEASVYGSPHIETEHLLLGLIREDKEFVGQLRARNATEGGVRQWIASKTTVGPKISTTLDLPLSHESKRVLAFAAEESSQLRQEFISTPHLVLGILRESKSLGAECLSQYGVGLAEYRAIALSTAAEQQRHEPFSKPRGAALPLMKTLLRQLRSQESEPAGELHEDVLPVPKADSLSAPIATVNRQLDLELATLNPEHRLKRRPWSRKEAMGHLVDLATTHHQWLARALTEATISVSGYPSEEWVAAQNYADYGWHELLSLWILINRLLMHLIAQVPPEKVSMTCRVGIEAPTTLSAVIERYVAECEDVLVQILAKLE